MIQPSFIQRQANGVQDQFRIYTIALRNRLGDICGEVKYVRLGANNPDTLDYIIYETIKAKYPLSSRDSQVYHTQLPRRMFKDYKRYKRLFLACRNYTPWDPAYLAGQIDSGLAIFLDVHKATKKFVCNECESCLRVNNVDIAFACNEEYNNFATYHEFFS